MALPTIHGDTMVVDRPSLPQPPKTDWRNQGIERDRLLRLEDVPHDFMCSICLGVVADNASETPCGHLFCTECIHTSLRRNPQCPLDKKPLQCSQLRSIREHNLPIRRIWGGIKVRCRFHEGGECQWRGVLGDASAHELRCPCKHGNPKDLKIRELLQEKQRWLQDKQRCDQHLAEASSRDQEARQRLQTAEEEQRRREHDFDFELSRRDELTRQKIKEIEAQTQAEALRANKAEQRCKQAEADSGRGRQAIDQIKAEHAEVVQDRERRLEAAARHAGDAERRADTSAQEAQRCLQEAQRAREEGAQRARELESAAENNARAAAANEQRARAAEFELERVAHHRQEQDASFRAQAEDLQRERNAATMERDRAVRDQRLQEQAAYAARGQLAEVEERLGAAETSRRDIALRLDGCERELYKAREAAKQSEDQLQRAERHFHEQLTNARARNVTPPSNNRGNVPEEFDGRYLYDRYNVVRLAQLILRSLETRPQQVNPARVFTCLASCYDDFKRGWTDNPQNYAIDVRMLLTVASASTWFNPQHQALLDGWLREQGWLGHNHRLAQQPAMVRPGGGAYPPPLVR